MKHYVQYHNTEKAGPLVAQADGSFVITTSKPVSKVLGQQMWLISGHGGPPRHYQLEYTFRVDEVIAGSPNRAIGTTGSRCIPPIPLTGRPWFEKFVRDQQWFSIGVREIQPDALIELQALIAELDGETPISEVEDPLDRVAMLTTDDFVQALKAIESSITKPQRAMLIGHAIAEGAALSMATLAELGGYVGHETANLQYGRLGGLLAKAAGIDGLEQSTQMMARAHANADAAGHWQWALRLPLQEALWELWPQDLLDAIPEAALAAAELDRDPQCAGISRTERTALIRARIGQGAFRKALVGIWDGRCAVTGCSLPNVLVASHAKAWKESNNTERLDPYNGFLLAASIDKLFDRGLISFDDEGLLLVKDEVTDRDLNCLGLARNFQLASLHERHIPYIRHHRCRNGYENLLTPRSGATTSL